MRRALYTLAIIIAAQVSLRAQEPQPVSPDNRDEDTNGFIISQWVSAQNPPFDRYREIPQWEELVRLDKFALELHQKPDMIGYIVARSRPGEDSEKSAERLDHAKNYLIFAYTIEDERIVTVKQCCYGAAEYELWIESPGKFWPNSAPIVTLEAKVKAAKE